jgi:molybdopterin-containing oxidoreductase family iron-sulfur binding subunit
VERLLDQGYITRRSAGPDVALDTASTEAFLRTIRYADALVKPVLYYCPSIRAFDGRSADIPLLHEIPDPLTTITYGGWVSVSDGTAQEMGLADKDEVALSSAGWTEELPVKIQPGLPRGVMMVQRGAVAPPPMAIDPRSGEPIVQFAEVAIQKTGKRIALPVLAGSQSQEGRGVIPEPKHNGDKHHEHDATMYPDNEYKEYRWGMAIDLDLCIGCSACTAACYIENNVPIVGPEEHLKGREMSWIRIEPFYGDSGASDFQPMLCQHCENAPCESVCPVFATYHNPEGLNAQVYNRCVGTRYCSNNCPYKVRRFNWFDFRRPTELNHTHNPAVSVRGRGVMEKCTFCVQRIRAARDQAKDEKRQITDGEVTPACAQTCPTEAIAFGSLLDIGSKVHELSKSDRSYRVFEHLGTGPAVYYLRKKWKKGHG